MDQSKATLAFLIHKNIAFFVIMAVGLLMVYHPPEGWNELAVGLFFVVSQISFYLGLLENMRFNGYGVHEQVNQMARATVVPNFGLTWHGFAVKPLARSWTFTLMVNTALAAVAVFFMLFPEEGRVASAMAPFFLAYTSAKLIALAGEVYVWVMADRHRHWYLVEERLHQFLVSQKRAPKAIDAIIDRARQAQLLITTIRKF